MFKVLRKIFFPDSVGKQYGTVRYAFPLVILSALFASLAAVITQDDSYITIKTNTATVTQDQQFYIDVLVTAHVAVNAVDLVIEYPSDKLAIDSIDTGTSVITLWTEQPHADGGKIYLRGGTFRKGFVGEHTVARIKAHATSEGDARILIKESQLVAGDGKGTQVPVTSGNMSEIKIAILSADGVAKAKAAITVITDTNGDGKVDLEDVSRFMAAWFTGEHTYDFNGDGRMTFVDFSILLSDSFFKK